METKIRKIKPTVPVLPRLKRVAAYARVSSVKDAMHMSLANQVSYYSGLIQRTPGWQYAGVFADDGMTGTKEDRPEFQRLLSECRAGHIDLVLTKSLSRFSRNTLSTLDLLRELKDIGVDVFFERENIHSMSGDGELMLTILSSFAQEESLSVSENCKWRIRKRFAEGELVSLRFLYGYDISRGKVEINPEQAAIVRMIFADYVGGMGGGLIAKKLREAGIPKPNAAMWTSNRVIDILQNEKYTGNALLQKKYIADHLTKRLVKNKGELPQYYAEGTHPAIIDMETFGQAQALLAARRESRAASDYRNRYPFTGMIRCGNCGKKYKRKVNKVQACWNCTTYLDMGKAYCAAKQIPEVILIQITTEVLGLTAFDESVFLQKIKEIIVPAVNRLVFVFSDGATVERAWQDKSRRDSWSEDMRREASARQREIWHGRNGQ